MRFFSALLLLGALLATSGCATMESVDEHSWLDLTDKTTIYRDQWVRRSPPEVYVRPQQEVSEPLTALFIPFRVTQEMDDPGIAGYTISRTFWQTWLSMQLFPAIEYSGDPVPYRRDRAVALARARGADLVIGGFVTHLYAGGTAGDSQVAVQLEIHDARSGQLVWSMAQAGLMPASTTTDYFVFQTKMRLPGDPIHAISKAMALDCGEVVKRWTTGTSAKPSEGLRKIDEDVRDALFKERDQLPDSEPKPTDGNEKSF